MKFRTTIPTGGAFQGYPLVVQVKRGMFSSWEDYRGVNTPEQGAELIAQLDRLNVQD